MGALAQGQIQVSVNESFEAPTGVVFQLAGGFGGEMFAGERPHTVHSFTNPKIWVL